RESAESAATQSESDEVAQSAEEAQSMQTSIEEEQPIQASDSSIASDEVVALQPTAIEIEPEAESRTESLEAESTTDVDEQIQQASEAGEASAAEQRNDESSEADDDNE